MKVVNREFLSYITAPLNGGADDDELVNRYWDIQFNNAEIIKELVTVVLKPYYNALPDLFRIRVKDTLSYYLYTDKVNFERLFNSNLLPFDHPDDAKLFYIWIWDVLFENENYHLINPQSYIENYDVNEPLALLSKR